jgi:anti-sigma regulatory factor (Ser/Thr protein kinase)
MNPLEEAFDRLGGELGLRGADTLFVLDTALRVVRCSTTFPGMRHTSPHEMAGHVLGDMMPGLNATALQRMLRHVLTSGRPVTDFRQSSLPTDGSSAGVLSFASLPVVDANGVLLGIAGTVLDITAHTQDEERLDWVDRAGALVGPDLDAFRAAQDLAKTAVPQLADAAAVDVMLPVLRGEFPPQGPLDVGAPFRRAAFESRSGKAGAYTVGETSGFVSATPYTQSLTDLKPRLIRQLDQNDAWLSRDPVRARRIGEAGAHSLMVIPLTVRGSILGVAAFYRQSQSPAFDHNDLALATAWGAHTALCLDVVRHHIREHAFAQLLQSSLLSKEFPRLSAVEVMHSALPSQGSPSGWFDVIPLSSARVALVVGTVAGQGLAAAAVMGQLKAATSALASLDLRPDELLARLDDLVVHLAGEHQTTPSAGHQSGWSSASCLCAVYDPVTRHCTVSQAGNARLLIANPKGTVRVPKLPAHPPLGAQEAPPYETVDLDVLPGSVLLLYAHSPYAAHRPEPVLNAQPFGKAVAFGQTLQEVRDSVLSSAPDPNHDQIPILLLARTHALSTKNVATRTLAHDPAAVAAARAWASAHLANWALEELDFTTTLVLSELVTNAINYSTGPVELRLIRDRTLICEVSDTSSAAPHARHPNTSDEGGRGLSIVSQLTQRHGTRYTSNGKTVWTEQTPGSIQ